MTEWVWGVDPSVKRIAIAWAPASKAYSPADVGSQLWHVETRAKEGERLAVLYSRAYSMARWLMCGKRPSAIWVEQPSGGSTNLALVYATGVIQAALFAATSAPVWTVPSGTWKKSALGAGNGSADKAQVMSWARESEYRPASEDEADAIGIAVAGRAMFVARKWGAAA